jgi:hypothetical protein
MFATLENVKRLEGSLNNTSFDAQLEAIIVGVNKKIEMLLNRFVLIDDYTEIFDILPTKASTYKLKGYPLNSVSTVTLDDKELIANKDYTVSLGTGRVQLLRSLLLTAPEELSTLTIVYNGGMATTEQVLREQYADLAYSACVQVIFEFKRKDKIAHESIAIRDGGAERLTKYGLLPEVNRTIRMYQNRTMIA